VGAGREGEDDEEGDEEVSVGSVFSVEAVEIADGLEVEGVVGFCLAMRVSKRTVGHAVDSVRSMNI